MSRYVRAKVEGGTYFLTLVTYRRRRLFHDEAARRCLHEAIEWSRSCEPFDLIDIVLLPDHLHLLICLPEEDFDFSSRMSRIKTEFTRRWSAAGGTICRNLNHVIAKATAGIGRNGFGNTPCLIKPT